VKSGVPLVVRANLASPRNNKARGRTTQQEVRDAILKVFPDLEPDDVRVAIMGESGEDIKLSPHARKTLQGFQFEVKRVKTLKTIYNWYEQAKTHGSHKPAVVFRQDRDKHLVILSLEHYLELLNDKDR
jgi:hypothetical protein